MFELSLGDTRLFQVGICYFFKFDEAIVGKLAFLDFSFSAVPHLFGHLEEIRVTDVIS